MPAFKSFAESIEKLTRARTEYDRKMAQYLKEGGYTMQRGVIVWHRDSNDTKNRMTDYLYRIDILRSKIWDDANVITTMTDNQ